MPYVERNEDGKITGVFANPQPGYAEEWVDGEIEPEKTPEMEKAEKLAALDASDKEMARVAEDIIGLLIEKELIAAEEIPQAVKDKLTARAALRQELAALEAE